jgi:hypothetical protein
MLRPRYGEIITRPRRRHLILVVWYCLLFTAGCDGPTPPESEPPVFNGYFTALKDGEAWGADRIYGSIDTRPDSAGVPVNRIGLRGVSLDELDLEDESISLGGPFRGEGVYEMESPGILDQTSGGFSLLDGDGVLATYNLFPPDTSSFTVTTYDSETGVMEGTFEMALERTFLSGHDLPPPPDTIRLTEGRFRVLVEDRR